MNIDFSNNGLFENKERTLEKEHLFNPFNLENHF